MKRPSMPGLRSFAAGALVLVVFAVVVHRAWEQDQLDRSFAVLALVSSLREGSASGELDQARSDAVLWSGFGGIRQRMGELEDAWAAMGPDAALRLQGLYVGENPFPEAERYLLSDPGDGSGYSAIHAEFHPRIGEFLAIHGYEDVLLINPSGRVAYTYHKGEDFTSNLLQGPARDTHLAEVVRLAPSLSPGETVLSDFEPHEPSSGHWALFVAAPIAMDGPGSGQGALVFQISPERIGRHLVRTPQQRRSSSSRVLGDGYRILGGPPWIERMEAADSFDAELRERGLREGAGSTILRKPDGRRVLAAWEPGTFEGIEWVVVSEVDLEEVHAEGADEGRAVAVVTLLLLLAWGVLTLGRPRPGSMARHRI